MPDPASPHSHGDAAQLAAAGMALIGCQSEDEVFGVIRDFLAGAVPRHVGLVSRSIDDVRHIVVHSVTGLDSSMLARAASLAGFEVTGKRTAIADEYLGRMYVRSLQMVAGGFEEYAANVVPATVAKMLAKVFGIHDVYIIGITDGSKVYGNISILTREPEADLPAGAIESLVYMAFLTLSRIEGARGLTESEERYRTILHAAMDGFWLADTEGRLLQVNDAYCRMSGYSEAELLSMRISDLVAGPSELELAQHVREIIASGHDRFEARHRRKDGGEFDVEISAQYRVSDGGRLVAFIQDITERKRAERALRDALTRARRFSDALDQVPAFIYMKDRLGRYVYANRATLDLFGCPAEELSGQDDARFFPPDAVDAIRAIDARVLAGESTSEEIDFVEPDGTRRVYWEVKTPLYHDDEGGEIWGLCGVSTDIAERKVAEESLRQRNEFIETVLDNAPLGFAVNRIDNGASIFVGRSFESIYGVPPGTLHGVDDFFEAVYLDPAYREQMRERIMADLASGDPSRMRWENVPIVTRKGEHKVLTSANIPLIEQNLMISTVQDVTDQWRAEEALRESEARYRMLTESMADVVWTLDPQTLRFLYVSPSVTRLRGLTPDEVIAEPMDSALTPEGAAHTRRLLADRAADRRAGRIGDDTFFTDEVEQPRKDASLVWTEFVTNYKVDEQTGAVVVHGVTRDIGARKASDAKLDEYRQRLEMLVEERTAGLEAANEHLVKANDELRVATAAKSEFLAAMSHELRTPLNSIIGFSGILSQELAGPLTDEQHAQLDMINRAGRHLLSLIDEVLDLARIEAGRTTIEIGTVEPDAMVSEVAGLVRPLASAKGLYLEVGSGGSAVPIRTDAGKVRQILFNLLGNAVKFTERGGVHVAARRMEDGTTTLSVTDTGPGIPSDELVRIFEPFTQIESPERAKPTGTGLGLRISREYAHLLGGEITVVSEPGVGSTFTLVVPAEALATASDA